VLFVFKEIQREVNRFLDAANVSLLTVDGKIGQKTVDGINLATKGTILSGVTNCKQVADSPSTYYNGLKAMADARNLAIVMDPLSIFRTISDPQPEVNLTSGEVKYPSSGVFGIPLWYLALAGIGGGYYYFYKTEGGIKRRKGYF
jgi:hypothetical protein